MEYEQVQEALDNWKVLQTQENLDSMYFGVYTYMTMDADGYVFVWTHKPFFEKTCGMWLHTVPSIGKECRCIAYAFEVIENYDTEVIEFIED